MNTSPLLSRNLARVRSENSMNRRGLWYVKPEMFPLRAAIVRVFVGLALLAGMGTEASAQSTKSKTTSRSTVSSQPSAQPKKTTASKSSSTPSKSTSKSASKSASKTTAPTKKSAASNTGETKVHVVQQGQTLGAIARRYNIAVDALCKANRIRRADTIRPGQQLVIPSEDSSPTEGSRVDATEHAKSPAPANTEESAKRNDSPSDPSGELLEISVHGTPAVYYYEPTGPGRLGQRPVIMVLHGRGGNAAAFCARWASIARPHGWLVCPSAPHPHASGTSWHNDWVTGKNIVDATILALRNKYGRRVQQVGNTLIGSSEGAFVAMNVGVREPRTFNRWMILAADDKYWGAAAPQLLNRAKTQLRRVALITGQLDGVYEGTLRTQTRLNEVGVLVLVSDPPYMGHVVALESQPQMYKDALTWLQK